MATPIGTNIVNSISRRFIISTIVDTVFKSNPVFFRLNAANKKQIQGGTHIEFPAMYARFSNGGPYAGFDLLDTAPNDTVKNLAFDWKQQYIPVTVDGLTLIKWNSPEAVANGLGVLFNQAEMEMSERLAVGLWSSHTDPKQIDGMNGAIDAGGVTTTYGGLTRSTNTWLNSQVDASTATLGLPALQSHFTAVGQGGRNPTLIASRDEQYNRYIALVQAKQEFPVNAGGHDTQLASAGFTNALFNNTPWVRDSHVPDGPNASNSQVVTLTEDYLWWVVAEGADFYFEEFRVPTNQDAMVAFIKWAGNLIVANTQRQGKMTALAA